MRSVGLTPPGNATRTYPNGSMQVFLDSGSTLMLLPPQLAEAIASDFGCAGADSDGFFHVDCSLATANGTLDFAFDGVTVRVPYREVIRTDGYTCVLGLQSSTKFMLLGDSFLRSAYVVFDLEDNNVWMAQYRNCGSSPAALASASSLATLQGACADLNAVVGAAVSSISTASSASAAGTSTTPIAPGGASSPTTTASPASGTSRSSASVSVARPRVAIAVLLAFVLGCRSWP